MQNIMTISVQTTP